MNFKMSDDIVLAAYLAGCASVVAYIETYMNEVSMHTNLQTGMVQDRFQHLGEIVYRHVDIVVTLLANVMAVDIIKPDDLAFPNVSQHICNSDRYWPYFKDCIGVIDGVYILVALPINEQHPYRGRKGITIMNCMCACDFDIKFTFACVGREGSTHDRKIFLSCLSNESDNFPKPSPGKYNLVDSGYHMKRGFLAPYKGEGYHLLDFQQGRDPHHPEDKFNYLHSSLHSIIERTFGVWKNR